jgi:secreted trypsin-like serine protease
MVFSAQVSPVCLPDALDGPVGQKCWISGWGSTTQRIETGIPSKFGETEKAAKSATNGLEQVDQTIIPQIECKTAYSSYVEITSEMICARALDKDGCQGDSGGPFVCQDDSGTFKLVGVVSWGL